MKETIAIVVGYLVFCVGNHEALGAGQKQLEQLSIISIGLSRKAGFDVSSLIPLSHRSVSYFHLAVILVVSMGIFVIAWLRLRSTPRMEDPKQQEETKR